MKAPPVATRGLVAGLLTAVALVTLSCTDAARSPTGVRSGDPAANDLLGDATSLLGSTLSSTLKSLNLLSCRALPAASNTETVGSAGGTIDVGPHSLFIPPGALDDDVSITAVAPSVPRREVQFQPEGLKFKKGATLTMSYEKCSLVSRLLPKKIVYVDDDLNILELLLSIDLPLSQKVTGKVKHFSGYAVAY